MSAKADHLVAPRQHLVVGVSGRGLETHPLVVVRVARPAMDEVVSGLDEQTRVVSKDLTRMQEG